MKYLPRALGIVALSAGIAISQSPILTNAGFEDSKVGEFPFGWQFGHSGPKLSYSAEVVSECCYAGKQCAVVRSHETHEAGAKGFLFQILDVRAYRNQKFIFRAAVRTQVTGSPSNARLLARIHQDNGGSCFFDNMIDHPIVTTGWQFYEISGGVCPQAHDLEVGLQHWGDGAAWMDEVSLTFVAQPVPR